MEVNQQKTTDQSIEQEIQDKGLTAPRITPDDIYENIAEAHFFTAEQGLKGKSDDLPDTSICHHQSLHLLTFCVLVLKNGFTVTGESACASPENFDARLGEKIALENAIKKIWPLMGYELKCRLSNTPAKQ